MAKVIRKLNENQGTMVITQNGEAKVVMMDIGVYEDLQESLSMLELIAQGNKNKTDGKYKPANQVLSELESRIQEDF